MIDASEIRRARSNWQTTCDAINQHARSRLKDVRRTQRIHRDTLLPIMPILEAPSPFGEYRKISEEVLKHIPRRNNYPLQAAEAIRAFLLLRFGMHLGVRQRNLRELLYCKRGGKPRSEETLIRLRRGELRWSVRDGGWEVFIPFQAFKNSNSSFFSRRHFRLLIPRLGRIYSMIKTYLSIDRAVLLGNARDPGTFFVRSHKRLQNKNAVAYTSTSLNDAWKVSIQKYGIFNPYTGRGAIVGLLPHGPHNIRDVLATHILKLTGSYELASYAIQSTPKVVAAHYGRFLPDDKASQAASLLNEVWNAPSRNERAKTKPLRRIHSVNANKRPIWLQYRKGRPPN